MYIVRCLQLPAMQEVYMEDLAVALVVEALRKAQDLEVPPNPDRVLDQHLGKLKFLNIFDYFLICHMYSIILCICIIKSIYH